MPTQINTKIPLPHLVVWVVRLYQENGISKICTTRVLGDTLVYYTTLKEKDLCVTVATDPGADNNPFAVKQLFEAIVALR